jgi:hypothetical protein
MRQEHAMERAVHFTAMGLQGKETMMRTALLIGSAAAALTLMATAAVRAETVYVTDPDAVVAPGYVPGTVYATEPDTIVRDRSYVVVAPPRERVIVVPRREVVIERPPYVAPRDSFAYRGTVPAGGYYTTGYSSVGSCVIDVNGFERCY